MRIGRVVSPQGAEVLARFDADGDEATPIAVCPDALGADTLRDLLAAGTDIAAMPSTGSTFTVEAAAWRSPLRSPRKIIAVGLNYADHALEANLAIPGSPMIFAKFPSAIVGHGEPIRFRRADSAEVDYESELAAVIGREARHVSTADALQHVFGYTVCNDVSARDAQFSDGQFTRGKSFDTFCPLGPLVVSSDEVADPQSLVVRARLNGTTVQDSSTKNMIFSVAEIISYLSRFMTLEPGDVIATGTPAGVGMARRPPLYLNDGDIIEAEVEGIGTLANPVQVS
jgi:2-keto-4-pentenoate hydratase/2-oxohepta-3-ene-1,7-dioic acid hydratase in catechol pathway